MRNALVSSLLPLCSDPLFCFLTGDLGFMALEPLRDRLGRRFINMGIAEQNMVSVAAGLAKTGMRPWVYSIGPFCYARPFEQIRNDICLHDLPVRLIGNGAGYGYGVQGPSHHSLEDCAAMGSLQNMHVFAPAFSDDIHSIIEILSTDGHPAYLRLGRDEGPAGVHRPAHEPFRLLCQGGLGVVLALGPLAGMLWNAMIELDESKRPDIWCCSRLPRGANDFPEAFLVQAAASAWTMVVEEHVAVGGLGSAYAVAALEKGLPPRRFIHKVALGYPGKLYGSQSYHRKECGLDIASLSNCIIELNNSL